MTTTTSLGTFTAIVPDAYVSADLPAYVVGSLGDFADDYDIDGLLSTYCEALNANLPDGTHLARNGELFAATDADADFIRDELRRAVEDVDFFELAADYDRS